MCRAFAVQELLALGVGGEDLGADLQRAVAVLAHADVEDGRQVPKGQVTVVQAGAEP